MSGFLSNTTKILTGNAASLVIVMFSLPVITRLYGPDVYGQLVIFNSLVSIGATITSLGYEKAFLLPRQSSTASILLLGSLLLVLLFSVLYEVVILIVGQESISQIISTEVGYELILVVPIAIALLSWARVFRFWSIRKNNFTNQAVARVSGTAMEKGGALGAGMFTTTAEALIATRIAGLFLTVIVLLNDARKSFYLWKRYTLYRIIFLAKRFSHFTLSSLSSLLSAASRESPYLLLAALFSPTVAAYFGLARGAIGVPLMQVSDALTRAFYQRIMKAKHQGEDIQKLCSSLLRMMILFTFAPVIMVYLQGEILVPIVFGQEWSDAGRAIGLVCISFFAAAVYRPIGILFDMLERQKERVYFNVLLLVASMLAILYGAKEGLPEQAMAYYVAVMSLLYMLAIIYLLTLVGMSLGDSLVMFLKPTTISVLGVYVPIYFVMQSNLTDLVLIAFSVCICGLFYCFVYFYDENVRININKLMKNIRR